MEKNDQKLSESVLGTEGDDRMVISLKKPIKFEGKLYEKIDLSGMDDIKAADMIAVNRIMNRNGNISAMQETTLEYALNIANIATKIPIEFFEQLPPYAAMELKRRVTDFLYGQE